MIAGPLNDRTCLGPVTEFVRRLLSERGDELAAVARRFSTTRELALWIRRKPQVDDTGIPDDGPKVYACRPPQRLRIFWESPNCFERTVEYVLLAELIDASPARAMATVNTRFGRHTLPVENNAVVVLDPVMTRNELEGALFQLDRGPLQVSRNEALDWVATIAEEPAVARGEVHRVRNARAAMRAVVAGLEITPQAIADIAYTVDEADREAIQFGARGRELHRRTAEDLTNALITQRRRNAGAGLQLENLIQIGAAVLQHELSQSTKSSGASASSSSSSSSSGSPSGRTQLGKLGVGNPLLMELERLIGRQGVKQGLTLGGVAIGGPVGGAIGSLAGEVLYSGTSSEAASPRNASFWAIKTPGVILDEILATDAAIHALDGDIADTFREPLSARQRVFVRRWADFRREWSEFVESHSSWYERMWRGAYDRAIEFRERLVGWRRWFEELGGTSSSPPPVMPSDYRRPTNDGERNAGLWTNGLWTRGGEGLDPALDSLPGDALIATVFRNAGSPRNASFWAIKTPGVILDEINTTDTAVRALGRDISDTFRDPMSVQQRAFVEQWTEFTKEWKEFVDSHEHWYDRMWRGSYDKAIEFRERVLGWRRRFEDLGGKPTAPLPIMPPDDGKPGPTSGPWKWILLVAGIGAAALLLRGPRPAQA
ncbi:MAG: hypothetical protein ACREBE_00060 [bacterium]